MTYQIIYDKPALKFLRKQTPEQQKRLVAAIHGLPERGDIKPMAGRPNEFRLRVGSYRVLYTVKDNLLIVQILAIGNRGDVYK